MRQKAPAENYEGQLTMSLFQTYEQELEELRTLYEERKEAGDFKACLTIKEKQLELQEKYLGSTKGEPPESFKTQRAVVAFLQGQGYKTNKSTLSLHVEDRKLIPAEDGEFKLDAVLAYAEEHLTNMPEQAKPSRQDDNVKEKKRIDMEMARLDLAERQGTLVDAKEVKAMLADMLVTFRTRVLLLPRKLSHQLAEIDEPHKVEETLKEELRGCLICLSEYKIGEETVKHEE